MVVGLFKQENWQCVYLTSNENNSIAESFCVPLLQLKKNVKIHWPDSVV